MSFSFSGPRMESFARRIASSRLSTKPVSDLIPAFRRASTERLALRMADAPSTNEETDLDSQIEEEEASTVLSTDDLDARIAALGLGEGKVLEDRSTGMHAHAMQVSRCITS